METALTLCGNVHAAANIDYTTINVIQDRNQQPTSIYFQTQLKTSWQKLSILLTLLMGPSSLTDDDKDDLLLACRYGDLEDVQTFVINHGPETLNEIRDNQGNCVLHMVCANGHTDLLNFLLPLLPPTIISAQNHSGSTPLHWAALNSHLDIVQKIVQYPLGPGRDLIEIKNVAGRSPLGEAELAGWEEGAKWFVQVMNLDHEQGSEGLDEDEGDATALDTESEIVRDIEVEIQDADGQISKMTISGTSTQKSC